MQSTRPLEGRTVLVTRQRSSAPALCRLFEEKGARAIACPTIELAAPDDMHEADACLRNLEAYGGVILTSANAVLFLLDRVQALGLPPDLIRKRDCYAIGPATRAAAEARGIEVKGTAEQFQAEGMVDLLGREPLEGRRFLYPRAREAREFLPRFLAERGAGVDVAVLYETRIAEGSRELLQQTLAGGTVDYLTFTSPSTIRFFVDLASEPPGGPTERTGARWLDLPAACIGTITAQTARQIGFSEILVAANATLDQLVQCVLTHARTGS